MSSTYFTARFAALLFLYFASGLPLALSGATLAAWLHDAKVDIGSIGLFAAAATPYTLKFLWSPLMDSLAFPLLARRLGRRRGWILATQIALMGALVLLAFTHPGANALATALVACLVAFLSASQDIVIDAYRVEILAPEEQGRGVAVAQLGYRLGMIASSAGALYLAEYYGWQVTYLAMSLLMLAGIVSVLFAKDENGAWAPGGALFSGDTPPPSELRSDSAAGSPYSTPPRALASLRQTIIEPFLEFMRHEGWWLILIFTVVYRLADAFIGTVTTPFLLEIGFAKTDIADIVKIYGTIATVLGTFAGGTLVARYGAVRLMFVAGFLHAVTNLLYVLQAHTGADAHLLAMSVAVENLSGGVSSAAFVAFLSNLCNRQYTATQYALLSSLSAFGRTWLATPAGYVAKYLGWEGFFALAALLALPGLLLLWVLKGRNEIRAHVYSSQDREIGLK